MLLIKIKKFLNWIRIYIRFIIYNISVALFNTEQEILKANPFDLNEKDKKNQRMLHRNPVLEKFYAGQTDQKYVKEYYEILKKADTFIKKSDIVKYGATADKHGMSYGKKDRWGRRYEHYGFFDPKSKHYGKTVEEVLKEEYNDRRTKDDNYELLSIHNNQRIIGGLNDSLNIIKKNEDGNYVLSDIVDQIKNDKFPIHVIRNNDVLNKIEQITDYLHIKRIDDEYRQLEFFINLKFGTDKLKEDDKIFNELKSIDSVWVYNDYGELISYKIIEYTKRIRHESYDVLKFFSKKMDVFNN